MIQFLALTLAGRLPPQPEGDTETFHWEWREAGVLHAEKIGKEVWYRRDSDAVRAAAA